jgi:SulP family sulfate permease
MKRMSRVVEFNEEAEGDISAFFASHGIDKLPHDVMLYSINGPLFFGVAEKFERIIEQVNDKPRVLILRMKDVPFIDMTGILALESMITNLRRHNVTVIITEAHSRVIKKLIKAGVDTMVGQKHFLPDAKAILAIVA